MNTEDIQRQFDIIARQYDEGRKCFIPFFEDFYSLSAGFLKSIGAKVNNVLDLGAGTGLLTKEVYMLYPEALFTLVDLSDDMLSVARKRFSGLDNFQFITSDYTQTLPGGDFNVICSALSIHHLEEDQKRGLYRAVYEALPSGGVFFNLDQFCGDSPALDSAFNKWWIHYIDSSGITPEAKARWIERRKLDRENSVSSTLSMLSGAGFQEVQCLFKFMKFASLVAVKME